MRVDFYHLARVPLERVLPAVCEKVMAGGERLLIVAEEGLAAQLDALLWTYAPESFLPHGRDDGAALAEQPILILSGCAALNGATNVALADGQWRDEALAFGRTFYFFDAAHIDAARAAWKTLKGSGQAELRYWKQDERGKWVEGP